MDGNHRVSVARRLGASHIEAYVTSVRSKVPLSPDIQLDDLVVKAEYVGFLENTHLDRLRPEADLTVTAAGQYEELEQHIEVQHFLMEMEQDREVSYEEAVTQWYDEFYLPVVQVIREQGILRDFPGRTETDLYIWTVKHRVALERELGWEIRSRAAVADLAARFSPRPERVFGRVGRRILDAVTPGGMEAGPSPGAWRRQRIADQLRECIFADILVAVNGKESGWHAFDAALEMACHEDGRLHGLHVLSSTTKRESEAARAVQIEFERRCNEAGISGKLALEPGKVAHRICERAQLMDLVVLSLSHPYTPQPIARLGSGLRAIIWRCPTPVLVVPGATSGLNRVLLAYDGSPKAEEALFVATYLAGQRGIPLVVVTVMEGDRVTQNTLAHARDYVETRRVQGTYIAISGPVAGEIMMIADENDCDFIVIGGYGFNPIREIAFGSTAGQILRTSGRPILICR
jgi:nucleotide-binding universal stress UspA family protein